MSKAKFTSEQQQLLRNNPYTVRVTEDVLYLSKEFKELFYKEYLAGAMPLLGASYGRNPGMWDYESGVMF